VKLYGKNPVLERIKSNPKSIRRILIEEGHSEASYIFKKCNQHHIPVSKVPYTKIQKLAQNVNTQGIMADIEDFQYMELGEMLDQAIEKKRCIIFLDNLTDPQNLGGIIRTAGSLGMFDIVLPSTEAVGVTESVLRVACGGENYLNVAKVSNLANAIQKAKDKGFWIISTAVKDAPSMNEIKFQYPMGFVLGSEEKGVRDVIRKKIDQEIMIPMKNERMSLNVAHAASIICWEVLRNSK
jgi:23S rRNA (guanosine2251-2'-O)-methyltransferase